MMHPGAPAAQHACPCNCATHRHECAASAGLARSAPWWCTGSSPAAPSRRRSTGGRCSRAASPRSRCPRTTPPGARVGASCVRSPYICTRGATARSLLGPLIRAVLPCKLVGRDARVCYSFAQCDMSRCFIAAACASCRAGTSLATICASSSPCQRRASTLARLPRSSRRCMAASGSTPQSCRSTSKP